MSDIKEEVEALLAIFPEFEEIDSKNFQISFEVPPADDGDNYSIQLHLTLGPSYPSKPPQFKIVPLSRVSDQQVQKAIHTLNELASECADMPMLYMLVQGTQDWLENLKEGEENEKNEEEQKKKYAEDEKVRLEEEAAKGTPVTVESFNAWKAKFDLEMAKVKQAVVTESKMTGKMYFDQRELLGGVAIITEPEIDGGGDAVDWELFSNELDEDLDEDIGEDDDE
eukprot:TRINITY_DN13720_c0_g1_i2.p1 TRINITY_DN13720_c0_g1~~TRINITY_DN13720_c0_g1_i2.p1  ORF type:complete len:225 (-),score=69.84 TRINITY_DN13720_c0_g1_i2:20-694(-)